MSDPTDLDDANNNSLTTAESSPGPLPSGGRKTEGADPDDNADLPAAPGDSSTETGPVSRRTFLRAGAAVAAAGFLTGQSAATTLDGSSIQFERTLNAVEDLGLDPTGGESIGHVISDLGAGTRLVFPEGTYQLPDETMTVESDNVVLEGQGDVTWRLSSSLRGPYLKVDGPDNFGLFNVDIDQTASANTSGHLHCNVRSHFEVADMEYIGRGRDSGYAYKFGIREDPDGTGVVRNCRAPHGANPSVYNDGNGRIGIYIGFNHRGTVRVLDCMFGEFGNNGIYASKTYGDVQVEDTYILNCGVNGIRLAGEGSWAKRCTVEVDMSKYDGPAEDSGWGTWGIAAENDVGYRTTDDYPPEGEAGLLVEDCEVILNDCGETGQVGAAYRQTAKTRVMHIRNSYAEVNISEGAGRSTHAFLRANPHGDWDRYRKDMADPPEPHSMIIENCVVTGTAAGNSAIRIVNAPNSVVRDTCIHQTGSDRVGIRVFGSDGTTIENTNVNVTGEAIDLNGGDVVTSSVTYDDTCSWSGSGDSGSGSDGSDDSGSDDSGSDDSGSDDSDTSLSNTITIQGSGSRAEYEFSVDDALEKNPDIGSINDSDVVDGTTATGVVGTGDDSYLFESTVTDFTLSGDATVLVNGTPVDPADLGSSTTLPNTLVFGGVGSETTYAFSVTGEVAKSADLGSVDDGDVVDGTSVSGTVTDELDGYRFSGDLEGLSIAGDANVTFEDKDG